VTAVAVIVPVLNRPQNVAPLVESWRAAKNEADTFLLFVVSDRDDAELQAIYAAGMASVEVPWPIGTRGDYARKINYGLWSTSSEFVLCAADDLRFHDGWADAAVAVLEETGTGFCGTNDQANPMVKAGRHATHPVVRRVYAAECGTIDTPGLIYHEGYWHQFVDNEATGTAMFRDCFSFAHDSIVAHRHPIFDRTIARDETYELGDRHRLEDRDLMLARRHLWAAK
jgi:glycosyltransferase involved in cell wall biosynthesis